MSVNRGNRIRPLMKKAPRKNRKKGSFALPRFEGTGRVLKVIAGMSVLLAISACFVSGYLYFIRSDCMRIRDVRVKGVSILSRQAVIDRAGIEPGANILAVNLSVARRRLQADPWIADVRISRELPSTIVIDVREHRPVAVMDWRGGLLIDSRRCIFKRLEVTDPVSLPVISGVDGGDLDTTGRAASSILNAALDAVETVSILGRRVPGMNIRKVLADRDTGLTLYAAGAVDEIRLGFDDDNDNYLGKFRRLNHMLTYYAGRKEYNRLAAAGFEYPDRVVVRTAVGDTYAATQKGGDHEGTGHHRRS